MSLWYRLYIIFNNLENEKTILSSWEAQKQTGGVAAGRVRGPWPEASSDGLSQGPQPLRLAESCLSLGLLVTALVPIGGAGAQPRLTRGEFCRARVSPACDSPVSRRHPRGALSARAAEFCRLSAHF